MVIAGIFFGKGLLSKKDGDEKKPSLEEKLSEVVAPKDKVVPVKAFKISRFNYEDSLNVLGTIKGAMEFKLSFEVPGVISSVNYREGERYEEGALLVSLRQDDILNYYLLNISSSLSNFPQSGNPPPHNPPHPD